MMAGSLIEVNNRKKQNLFNYSIEQDEQFQICWSLKNLRPLSKVENRSRPKDGRDLSKEQMVTILGHNLYCVIMSVENEEEFKDV